MNALSTLFDLTGRVAIVTGATGHLGKSLCYGLAQAGSNIAACSTSKKKADEFALALTNSYGVDAAGFELDLKDTANIKSIVEKIYTRFGRVDCLVNNAFYGKANDLMSMSPEEWTTGIEGTLSTQMYMLQSCVPYLEQHAGNIINISSMYGMVSPNPEIYGDTPFANPPNYGAGKAALLQLTRYAAVHLAPKGIRVNAISPGPFPSPAVQSHEAFIRQLERKVPLNRIGQPEELQGAVVFLASDAASYITGHNLVVDGGWTIW